jgi:hypothetical protein
MKTEGGADHNRSPDLSYRAEGEPILSSRELNHTLEKLM